MEEWSQFWRVTMIPATKECLPCARIVVADFRSQVRDLRTLGIRDHNLLLLFNCIDSSLLRQTPSRSCICEYSSDEKTVVCCTCSPLPCNTSPDTKLPSCNYQNQHSVPNRLYTGSSFSYKGKRSLHSQAQSGRFGPGFCMLCRRVETSL